MHQNGHVIVKRSLADLDTDDVWQRLGLTRPTDAEAAAAAAAPIIEVGPAEAAVDDRAGDEGRVAAAAVRSSNEPAVPTGCDPAAAEAELRALAARLADVARRDDAAREAADRDLEQYDALVAEADRAEMVAAAAGEQHRAAEARLARAFDAVAEAEAGAVADAAAALVADMSALATRRRAEAAALAGRPELARRLDERRREDEQRRAETAAQERAEQVATLFGRGEAALRDRRLDTAEQLAAEIRAVDPTNPAASELAGRVGARRFSERLAVAEAAVRGARSTTPAAVIAEIGALDLDGLDEALVGRAVRTFCEAAVALAAEQGLAEPRRHRTRPDRVAVLARDRLGAYRVVASRGLGAAFRPGLAVSAELARRARPLRRDGRPIAAVRPDPGHTDVEGR